MRCPAVVSSIFACSAGLFACAAQMPDYVQLMAEGETVEFAAEPPSPNTFKLVGQVHGEAAAKDPDAAQQSARNDLRNKAAALGASLVTIDENLGEPVLLQEKTGVRLTGRAYKSVD